MRWKRGQRLKLVSESDARGPTRKILAEVRQNLGVPIVPQLYQAYAAFPGFLEVHWQAFRPVLQPREFFLLGSRLSAESYTRAHNYFEIRSFCDQDAPPQVPTALSLTQMLDYYQHLDSLLLLISAAQMQAFEGPVGQAGRNLECTPPRQVNIQPSLLQDAQAGPDIQRSWNERRRALDLSFVPDEHRALACRPEFYGEYWSALKALLESPVYADCRYRLGDSALSLAGELPVRVETSISQLLDAGMSNEEVASVTRINEVLMQAMTGLLLDVTFARVGCEKGASAERAEPQQPDSRPIAEGVGSPFRAA